MGGGMSQTGQKQLATTNAAASGAGENEQNLYGSIQPFLQQEMTNPQVAAAPAITASNEALGGATAGAMGQGALQAARTNNSAGEAPALDQSVRQAGQTQAGNALGITAGVQQAGEQGQQALLGTQAQQEDQLYGLGPSTISSSTTPGFMQSFYGALGKGLGGDISSSFQGAGAF